MKFRFLAAMAACLTLVTNLQAQQVQVTITNNAPTGGVALTPLWVGFHDGSFDSYNGGLSSQPGLERLAEDGNVGDLATPGTLTYDFANNQTYVDNSSVSAVSATVTSSQVGTRVQGVIASQVGPPPIQPGQTTSQIFNLASDGSNDLFSYASMILPSNDYYVANGNPLQWNIASVIAGGGPISFNIAGTSVNDAGTEVNDFTTAAPGGSNLPGLFPGIGLPDGQSGPDTGVAQSGVNADVTDPFANFLNADGVDISNFNFTDGSLYSNGIATITISSVPSAVPEPSSFALIAMGIGGLVARRRRNLVA